MRKISEHFGKIILAAIFGLTLAAAGVSAATFTVTNTNNSGPGSLRQTVLDSNATAGSDTIVFDSSFNSPQTITLASQITINPATGDSLTITGPGASLLTVSGNSAITIFQVSSDDTVSLSGMTLTLAGGGFAAISNDGNLTVTNSTFSSNSANASGGIYNLGESLTITGCTFTNNTAGGGGGAAGGAIDNFSGSSTTVVTITDSTFTGNSSPQGGAVFNRNGTMTITNSTFSNNTATGGRGGAVQNNAVMNISGSTFTGNSATNTGISSGGAISSQLNSQLTITNSIITGNSAATDGGGIYHQPNGLTPFLNITNSTISNNTANSDNNSNGDGGGLLLEGNGLATITNSTISGNTANFGTGSSGNGGGIYANAALNLTNSTVSGNFAGQNYGGVFDSNPGGAADVVNITSSTIVNNTATGNIGGYGVNISDAGQGSIRNTIVANNTANGGTSQDINGPINSLGYNLFETTTGATITGTTATNITGVDPNVGPLQNNGGPTFTHALLTGSPAIDKGESSGSTTDQRGQTRPVDNPSIPNAAGGDGADIGAFEVAAPPTAAGVSVSGRVFTPDGRGLGNATVWLTDANGDHRPARTNPFGYYRFNEVAAGATYVFSVQSKRYSFAPRIVEVNEDVEDLNFTASPEAV